MHTDKRSQSLPGVGCEVTNCIYNGKDQMCHAEHILVEKQRTDCDNEIDTFCGTFKAE